jgi:hypothetical protein
MMWYHASLLYKPVCACGLDYIASETLINKLENSDLWAGGQQRELFKLLCH